MSTQLRERAGELAAVLWREHTVYRDRAGGVVIRGEHVERWISLAPAGGRDEVLLRAGRLLDGGTTAPARSEVIMPLSASTAELAAACRRLLADTAADAAPRTAGPGRDRKPGRRERAHERRQTRMRRHTQRRQRHTSLRSWVVLACVAALVAYYLSSTGLI
ncbi:hypothetical protein AB0A69_23045 [Streptomyces sp. NPDC045431]|uniref:hypothetical protein n=1 Tax=Streptomyces sp. NPDC045431 TaxID=3155613 RepID=UPI0033F13C84